MRHSDLVMRNGEGQGLLSALPWGQGITQLRLVTTKVQGEWFKNSRPITLVENPKAASSDS